MTFKHRHEFLWKIAILTNHFSDGQGETIGHSAQLLSNETNLTQNWAQ